MKLNNKGFMMAEVVVVSAIVLVTLTSLYASYNKIYSLYSTRLNYNDVQTLYKLVYYRDCIIKNGKMSTAKNNSSSGSVDITDGTTYLNDNDMKCNDCSEKIYFINNDKANINRNVIDSFPVNQTYKDYVTYLADAVNLSESDYVMIMEKCDTNKDNCKYAYLEIKDEA